MTHSQETNGKLLTEAEVAKIAKQVESWMREPEQWRRLLTDRFNALLADRQERIKRNNEAIDKLYAKMCELDTPKRGELHLLLISLLSA